MNEIISLIKNHRSIRRFTDQAIDPELFKDIIVAGQAASTSSFIQAVSIIRVTKDHARAEFVELSGGQKYIASAAEFLVFCADLGRNNSRIEDATGAPADFEWTEQFLAATVDVALLAQNIVIAAESTGLGCCYIGGIRNDPARVTELLSLPQLVYPVFGLCIGYPDQQPDVKPRLPESVILHQDQYRLASDLKPLIDGYDAHVREYYVDRTAGKLDQTWSDQMTQQANSQSRPFMLEFLRNQGFMKK